MASVLAITVPLCLCTSTMSVATEVVTPYGAFVDRPNLQLLRSKRGQEWEKMGSLPEFLVKCLYAFFSELQTCFHDQVQSIKVMLVAAVKIASLKKNLSKLQGVGLFQKEQSKVAHLATLIKKGSRI